MRLRPPDPRKAFDAMATSDYGYGYVTGGTDASFRAWVGNQRGGARAVERIAALPEMEPPEHIVLRAAGVFVMFGNALAGASRPKGD